MRLIPQHRKAVAAFGLLFLVAGAAYWFLVRPIKAELFDNAEEIAKKEKRLQRTGLPLDSALLQDEIDYLDRQLNGTNGKPGVVGTTKQVLEASTAMFMERVTSQYGTPELFRRNADRVFFQSDFSRIVLKLAEQNVHLAPAVLGISDESPSPYIYQLILRIWTVERLTDLAAESGLTVATVPEEVVEYKGEKVLAADIQSLDVRGYTLAETDKLPYLVEFPVQAVLAGNLEQVKTFLRKLTSDGNFLPASQVEIFAAYPAVPKFHDGRHVLVNEVRLHVRCSAFFLLAPAGTLPAGNIPGGA